MSKNIITLEEQKHLAVSFPSLFQNLSTVEVDSILEGLGLDQIVNPEGGIIPKYTLDVASDKPVYITNSFDIKIKGTLFNYYADESEKITSWSWSRDSGNISEDTNWAIDKNTRELVLTETDFTSRISNTDIVFTLTASIGNLVFTDIITFSKFQTLSKVNIKTSSSIFLGDTPESIFLEAETSETIVSYKWFINGSLVGVASTHTLSVLEVALKSIANIKLEAINDKGEVLTDFISIPRIANGTTGSPGSAGPPGINGTTGPSPRLLEFVDGASYENGGTYIDYAYFRSNTPSTEGWYTVKLPTGHTTGTVVTKVYSGGIPSASDFNKAPFTKEMSFGTIVAEQANLAGFIFRNQMLTSQQGEKTKACHPSPDTFYPNLALDGIGAMVKFLDRMILDKSGIILKDDCGVRRMAFQWGISGVPILKFFAEDGITVTWEAGDGGYKTVTIIAKDNQYAEYRGVLTDVNLSDVPTTVDNIIYKQYFCKCYFQGQWNLNSKGSVGWDTPIEGYQLERGTNILPDTTTNPIPSAADKKITISNDYTSTAIADGWYLIGLEQQSQTILRGEYHKIVGGFIVAEKLVDVAITYGSTFFDCGTHGFPSC